MAGAVDFFTALTQSRIPDVSPDFLIISAHPDDEVLGAGGVLPYMKSVNFLHITDGAPRKMRDAISAGCDSREAYARVRRGELVEAIGHAGFGDIHCSRMGIIDQEVSLNMVGLTNRIVSVIKDRKPGVILTHAFEGGHPDHDATAFAVRSACKILGRKKFTIPEIVEFASYHGTGNAEMVTFEFVPFPGTETWVVGLSERDREVKEMMIGCYRSQRKTLQSFPIKTECFRIAPDYDFLKTPHDGLLFYEFFEWGMSFRRWVSLALEATDLLGIH